MVQVLRSAGRVVATALHVLAGVLTSLGAGGIVGAGTPPTPPTAKREEYRP